MNTEIIAPPDRFPAWWGKLSPTLCSYRSSSYLTDLHFNCQDGVEVQCHQLMLGHASPVLGAWLEDCGEEEVRVDLPWIDSQVVDLLVQVIYTGALPQHEGSSRIQHLAHQLAVLLGIQIELIKPGIDELKAEKIETISPIKKASKKVCPLCFKTRLEHLGVGSKRKCCKCETPPLNRNNFFRHLETHIEKEFICDVCSKVYWNRGSFNSHRWKLHGKGKIVKRIHKCTYKDCKYSANNLTGLHNHINVGHKGLKSIKERISCPKCKKLISKYFFHRWHSKICFGESVFQCDVCGKNGFVSDKTLENHVLTKHSNIRPFQCNYCISSFPTSEGLSSHRTGKHGVNAKGEVVPRKVFPCNQCGKILTTLNILQKHKEVVHEGKHLFSCSFCDKTFSSEYNMKTHEGAIHTGILPHKCHLCEKMFGKKKSLEKHLNNHNNDGNILLPLPISAIPKAEIEVIVA